MGTTFYKITLDNAIDAYESTNIIVWQELLDNGWDAFDISKYLYGSAIIDDVLYVCDTDGTEIAVDGFGAVEPEEALETVDIELLNDYIIVPDAKQIVNRLITPYDLNDELVDLDDIAIQLLEKGYSFMDILRAAKDAQLVED